MRKVIVPTLATLVAACGAVLLLSACTIFSSNGGSNRAAADRSPALVRAEAAPSLADGESHYLTGCLYQERKKHRLAVEEFQLAVACDPGHVAAHNGLGVSLDTLGDHKGAVVAYKAALVVDPNRDYVLNNLGYSYLLQDRADQAVAYFQKAVALDVQNGRYRNNLGLALARSGDHEAAFEAFKANGDEASAHRNLARLYFRDGLYQKANDHFAQAAVLKPADVDLGKGLAAARNLARIHAERQSPTETKVAPKAQWQAARQGRDGFSTIPAGAIEDLIVKIDWEWQAKQRGDSAEETENPAIHTVALTRIANLEEERAAVRKDLEAELLKVLDELQAMEMLRLEPAEDGGRPVPRIKIEVSNGNGVRHMARQVGDYLSGKGFILMYLSNARHFHHDETSITYTSGYLRDAWRLSQELPGLQSLQEVAEIRGGHAEISVIIGRDLAPYSDLFEQG
jgi:Flp pilus assembly protein TadD